MKIAAKTREGTEFCYSASSAHRISERSAARIVEALNENRYQLRPGEKWHVYNIDEYSAAYIVASCHQFTIRNGYLYEKRTA